MRRGLKARPYPCPTCNDGRQAVPDITEINNSLPQWPDGMPLWQKIFCLFGYHKWEPRQTAPGHCFGFQTGEGTRKGKFGLHDESPMKLRDQCARFHSLR